MRIFDEGKRINNYVEYGRLEILTKKLMNIFVKKMYTRLEISPKKHV